MKSSIRRLVDQAAAFQRDGRLVEAIATLQEVVLQAPHLADVWYDLGYALAASGDYAAALAAYASAIGRGVQRPEEVHLNRAVIFSDQLRRDEDAERELKLALTKNPGYAPALLNLGNLHEERGNRQDAIACYEKLIASNLPNPDRNLRELRCEALARRVHLSPPMDLDPALVKALESAAADAAPISDGVRANAYFSIGRLNDLRGEYERAFSAFTKANALARQAGRPYSVEAQRRLIDSIINAFPRPVQHHQNSPIMGRAAPLFICGMFRSGSTLVEQVLASHPLVQAGGEIDFFMREVSESLAPFPSTMASFSEADCQGIATRYLKHLAKLFPDAVMNKQFITDKRPDNYLLIGLIKRIFPSAKIIHTVRNPLDNGLSVFMQHLNSRFANYSNDLGDIGRHYGEYRRLMRHWQSLYSDSIFEFDYDNFVRQPRIEIQGLLDFIQLPWHDRCMTFHETRNTVKTASYWQVRRPLYAEASGRWQHYERFLGDLMNTLNQAGIKLDHSGDLTPIKPPL